MYSPAFRLIFLCGTVVDVCHVELVETSTHQQTILLRQLADQDDTTKSITRQSGL
jgi:hypothetical protein